MNMLTMKCSVLFLLCSGIAQVSGQSILDDVFSSSSIARLRQSRLHHVSSSDTTGGNDDFIKIAPGRTVTIRALARP